MSDEEMINTPQPDNDTAEMLPESKPLSAAKPRENIFLSDWFLMLALYVAALVIHILMTQATSMFNLTPDEYAVTGIAAYANGLDWSRTVSAGGYYGYFQSIFYIPVFSLVSDPAARYQVMLLINGFIMSFTPVIVFYLSRNWFKVRKLSSVFIAIICGMYPSYLLLTKYTWNETMCSFLPWVFALLMYRSLKSHQDTSHSFRAVFMQQLWAVLAGVTLIAAYATHGRMLALTAAGVVLELVVLLTMKRRLFSLVGFFGGLAGAFMCDKMIKHFIQSALWLADQKEKASVNTIENMLGRLTKIEPDEIERFPQTFFGHFFYFFSSTWGFGAICVVLVISGIVMYYTTRRKAQKNAFAEIPAGGRTEESGIGSSLAIFCWYALLVMGAIFVVSVSFKATSTVFETRADTTIFGRYIESFFPIAMFAALVMIYRKKFTTAHCFGALILAAFVFVMTEFMTVSAVIGEPEEPKNIVAAMILGIGPLRIGEGMKSSFTDSSFIKMIAVTMACLLAVFIVRLIRNKGQSMFNAIAVSLMVLLTYSTIYGFSNYTIPQGKNAANGAKYVSQALDMIKDCEYDDVLCFSMKAERYSKAQFLYPEMHFRLASGAAKLNSLTERPDFIISARENNLNMWIDDIYLVGDVNHNTHLYACSQEAIEWCRQQGLELTEPGAVVYTGDNIPATNSVTKENGESMLPEGSAVYTNYFTLHKAGTYTVTIKGEDIQDLTIAVTGDKKKNDLPFEVINRMPDEITLAITSKAAKTENVQIKLTNKSGGAGVSVSQLCIERTNQKPLAVLPEAAGVTLRIS